MIDNRKLLWLWLASVVIAMANARQIRYNRFATEVVDTPTEPNTAANDPSSDAVEIEATVREVKLAPYPASGHRPSKAFRLPTEQSEADLSITAANFDTTTAAIEADDATTAATEEYATTTEEAAAVPLVPFADFTTQSPQLDTGRAAPYPAAGFRPKIPFSLPSETLNEPPTAGPIGATANPTIVFESRKAPYPAAGFRPAIAFLLPTEELKRDVRAEDGDNSKHPVCGSSTNPLAPKPLDTSQTDPDSETIYTSPQTVVVPMRLAAQSLLLPRPRPLAAYR